MPSPVAVAAFRRIANALSDRDEEGQDLLEYAVLVALIALVAVGAVSRVGDTINAVLWEAIAAASI
jgi:Flp pilus assembly pilin Flp